jgi:hypothetical protein
LVIARTVRPLHEYRLTVAPRKERSTLHLGWEHVMGVEL